MRLARFQREAEVLATLNHPNIGAIYGFEQAGGATGIVLELIEGETLAEQLQRGEVPVARALAIAKQIAEALEAAHERGIVHRDLKPANIKITPDDKVKVLDFGLAKIAEAAGSGIQTPAVLHSPTLSMMATQAGMILGTAAYMSPEQAKGFPADQRSDVFAFGTVLYEMLTGRQPFQGDTAPDVLASVIVRDVDLAILPSNLNPRIAELLRRCLDKNPKRRWQAIGDVRAEIETVIAVGHEAPAATGVHSPWRRTLQITGLAVASSVVTGLLVWQLKPAPATSPPAVVRFGFALPDGQRFTNTGRHLIAIAPDGTDMAYVANAQIHLRVLATGEVTPLLGTATQQGVVNPVFSPDGQFLAFWSAADGTLRKIAVRGADVPLTLARADRPFGVSWTGDHLFVGQGAKGIMRVPANGGAPEAIVTVAPGELAHGPQMLPDGEHVLFTITTDTGADRWDRASIVLQSTRSGKRTTLIRGGTEGRYLPTGHLAYARGGTVFVAPFNVASQSVSGAAVPAIQGVRRASAAAVNTGVAQFAFSETGTLIYIPGSAFGYQQFLAFLDKKGTVATLKLPPAAYSSPRISPDSTHIAFELDTGDGPNVWVYEISGATASRRLTFGGQNRFPIWSADGTRITFQSDRDGDLGLFWQRADGSGAAERLTKADKGGAHVPDAWSSSGDRLLFSATVGSVSSLWVLSHRDRKSMPIGGIQGAIKPKTVLSPDDRWIAYQSLEGGRRAIFVQPFPPTGSKYQVALGEFVGNPLWGPDGHELFYNDGPTTMRSVSVTTVPNVRFGNPVRVAGSTINDRTGARNYDITRDGQRFIGVVESDGTDSSEPQEIRVVVNWFEELKQRVPTRD